MCVEEADDANLSRINIPDVPESEHELKRVKKSKHVHKEEALLKKDSPVVDKSSTPAPILEGKMVSHPHKDEEIMVLLDNTAKVVYSGLKRTDEDGLIVIGRIRSSGKIKWKADAFENGESRVCLL